MDERPVAQRKLSKRNSKNEGRKSLWHRKSSKKATEATATPNHPLFLNTDTTHSLATMDSNGANDSPRDSQDTNDNNPPFPSHSVIPDPLGELPVWSKKESEMAAANVSTFRIRYPLHNPDGPRWYKNHHLIPPSSLNPPPSFFSPSFPPMVASAHDLSEDSTRLPGPSRSPSGTPLPTPNSSQVRIPEIGGKPRSRKTSQDNVDLMDVSDPWGTHWHHESPYDLSTNNSPVSTDTPEGFPRSRSRLSSLNGGQTRHKTVNPSPLSQSTSAVHLQPPEPQVTRKISKRRKPVLASLFGPHDKGNDEATSNTSPDASSIPNRSSTIPNSLHLGSVAARRHSVVSPISVPLNASSVALSTHSTNKKEKRGSVLGRLVRKFSILKRVGQDTTAISEAAEDEKHPLGVASSVAEEGASRRSIASQRQPSPEKPVAERKYPDPSKRVPPPRIDSDFLTRAENGGGPSTELGREINDHRLSVSDIPFSPLGKLTITNPDIPSSSGSTPVGGNVNLPSSPPSPPETERQVQDNGRPFELLQMPLVDSPNPEKRTSFLNPPTSVPLTHMAGKPSPMNGLLSPLTVPAPSPSLPEVAPTNSSAHFITRKEPASQERISPSNPAMSTNVIAMSPPPSQPTPEPIRPVPPHLIVPSASDSPLSRASMLANPPTPCNTEDPHTELPDMGGSSKRPAAEKAASRDVSPTKPANEAVSLAKSNSTTSRKTETFKLVRSPSKKSASESIMVEGEQWLLINAEDALHRRRTKDKRESPSKGEKSEKTEKSEKLSSRSRDREVRKDPKKQDKAEASDNRRRSASHARTKSPPVERGDHSHSSSRPSRARSLDGAQRPTLIQPMVFTLQDQPPRVRKGDDRHRDSSHSKSSRPGPGPMVAVARMERVPSNSARPTSELTSTADINSLKAREAWEMDRLWKGRSMYHGQAEATFVTATSSSTKGSRSTKGEPSQRDVVSVHGASHGSSHTSYVVQPLQAHPIPASVFYANMPSAPPPIIYTSASPYGQIPHPSRDYATFRSLPNFNFPTKEAASDPPSRLPNPLPAPPRESSYQPTLLPALADRSSGSASEYWTKYTSVPSH